MFPTLGARSRGKKVLTSYTPSGSRQGAPEGPAAPELSVHRVVQQTPDLSPERTVDRDVHAAYADGRRARLAPTERFDTFYSATWVGLLTQTFAICGDLTSAREATLHAFVDTWHHWSRAEWRGPAEHLRSRAFARATLRSRTRLRHREQPVGKDEQETLTALAGLAGQPRRAVVLACLSDLANPAIGRQIAETEARVETLVDESLATLGQSLGVPGSQVPERLRALEPAARAAARPTASEIRGQGVRRRRVWLGGGAAAAVVLTLGAGVLVHADPPSGGGPAGPGLGPDVTSRLLLPVSGLAPLGRPTNWSVRSTSDNTRGTGINTFCQASRFADPMGLRAFVRSYRLDGAMQRRATQTIELSRTPAQSSRAYSTVLGWFGGCSTSRLQLLSSYNVRGLGDEAEVIKMRAQVPPAAGGSGSRALSSYAVGVVRTGHVITWTAFTTRGATNPSTGRLVAELTNALQRVCTSKAAGSCASDPSVKQNPPPPSGEQVGMLATADLPPVPGTDARWAGTDAARSRSNPSATTCDSTSFVDAGADPAYVRTFLKPGGNVPPRFGLTETLGRLPGRGAATKLVAGVAERMSTCEKRDLGATVSQEAMRSSKGDDSGWQLWRLESQVSEKQTVDYWMGVARVGSDVVQVAFVPGDGKQDLTQGEFTALMVRARDRLFELDDRGAGTGSARG